VPAVHELSLCQAVVGTVTDHAEGRRVTAVRLRIGHFRQIVPDTMKFCWSLQVAESPLAGSVLHIDEVPAVAECRACGDSTTLTDPVVACATCGSTDADLVSGEEFLVESIDVATDAEVRP
jgi:hydrogenase nickel incorporation protein HypA/HybF